MTTRDSAAPALDARVVDSLRQLGEPGEGDVLAEILGVFVAEAEGRMAAIAAAVASRDAEAVRRAAHALKGAAGTIGATTLEACCRALEELGRNGELQSAPALVEAVQREYVRVRGAIDDLL